MSKTYHIAILSDIHYAADEEFGCGVDHHVRIIKNPFARLPARIMQHFVWMREHGLQNRFLARFLSEVGPVDHVIANGDYTCDTGHIGVSHPASFASARECLGRLRARFGDRFHASLGDHDLGKAGTFSSHGAMKLDSWRRAVGELGIEPFWRLEFGKYVLLGVTSSLIALPWIKPCVPVDELAEWERLRERHLQQICAAFRRLQPGQRVILFLHDPTALPFLWREPEVRGRLSHVEHTAIGHLHSNLILWKCRLLSGLPTISIFGQGIRLITAALGDARYWKPFRVRLCPALTGIQLLKDGGYLMLKLDADAVQPAQFEYHHLSWK